MRRFCFLALTACLVLPLVCSAQQNSWVPLTEQEKAIKEVPGNPGADAIELYYYQLIDDNSYSNNAEWDYVRIKILTEKGKDHADVNIPLDNGLHIRDLKARTIHPDGSIVDFQGKAFETAIVKAKGFKYQAATFTFPAVTVGSILEYRYKIDYPANLLPYHVWDLQQDLYTLKEHFKLIAYTGQIRDVEGMTSVSASYNLPPGVKLQRKSDGYELDAENIAPFEGEPFMPPPQPYRYRVSIRYGDQSMAKAEKFWKEIGLKAYLYTDGFIGNHKEIRQAANEAVAGEADPEKKLRKLYARVQQIRNLSYERPRTQAEEKKEDLKTNNTVVDVLQHKYGTASDITMLFTAMARAEGVDAILALSTNRSGQIFEPTLLAEWQLAAPIVIVNSNGKQFLLDPGTRFCPFGLLRWYRTATQALLLEKAGGVMVNIPLASYTQGDLERNADVQIAEDGTLTGDVTVRYNGYGAMEWRLDALQTDEAGRNKKLEDELKGWLPNGAVVKLKDAQPWDKSEEPLVAHFTVRVPSFASFAGKRLITPDYLFGTAQKHAFSHKDRKYPVYFWYAFAEIDNVNIKVPAGFTVEDLPQQQDATLPYARYQSLIKFDGQQISNHRALLIGQNFFPLEKYQELKGFFSKVETGDEQQAVLQKGVTSAQK